MSKSLPPVILENLNTAVLLIDSELRVVAMNPAAEMLFSTGARQAVGQPLVQLMPHNQALIESIHACLLSDHPVTEHGLRLIAPGGGNRTTVDCTVTPLTRPGSGTELILEINPIGRLLRLAREESRHDQHAASRAVIRGLAHEIKNPLGGLRGAAQLLERELPSPALREYTQIIIHEADRLRNLVDRMIGPNTPLHKVPTNIHQVMERVRTLIQAEVPTGIQVERDFDPSIPELQADHDQLIQATLNIARNAVQALEGEGVIRFRSRVLRQFTIGTRRHRLVTCVEIEDSGPGIPAELRESIFYPLVTGKPDGTGLGLSIAQDIIQQHGGSIEFSSQPGQTIFRVYLPVTNDSHHEPATAGPIAEEQGNG